jgi:hypothetical protein
MGRWVVGNEVVLIEFDFENETIARLACPTRTGINSAASAGAVLGALSRRRA